jgi:nucleosome binding factor SPN SPT16 subunit
MLKIEKNDEGDESEEEVEEEESTSEDEIQDDFLDWPIDCKVEILKAKKNAISSKKNIVQWSG